MHLSCRCTIQRILAFAITCAFNDNECVRRDKFLTNYCQQNGVTFPLGGHATVVTSENVPHWDIQSQKFKKSWHCSQPLLYHPYQL